MVAGGAAAGVMLLAAAPAWAHLDIDPGQATAGETATLTFRVPNESTAAATTKVQIQIPAATPIAVVRFQQVSGWTAVARTEQLPAPVNQGNLTLTKAVSSVTFTARPGQGIQPGGYADFGLTLGPLPDVGSIGFPSVQTYDDGKAVQWNQPTPASGEEPDHPMPTLVISSASAGHGAEGSDGVARTIGVMALVAAAAAGLVGAIALRQRNTRKTPTALRTPSSAPPAPVDGAAAVDPESTSDRKRR